MTKGGYVYILTNRPAGTLYIGVTANLEKRLSEHRLGVGSKFTHRYNLHRLVYYEAFDEIEYAIAREKQLKAWRREWKVELVEKGNPTGAISAMDGGRPRRCRPYKPRHPDGSQDLPRLRRS